MPSRKIEKIKLIEPFYLSSLLCDINNNGIYFYSGPSIVSTIWLWPI